MRRARRLRVALVEPYYEGSHRSWADGLVAHSRHHTHLLTHAGGFWKWRMHGAAVTLGRAFDELARSHGPPDVVLASDMVNVAALAGLARHAIGDAAVAVYMHENQLTYPLPSGTVRDEGYAVANWTSMCAADAVIFNSEYHRLAFWEALPGLLRRFPDHRHTDLVEEVRARSHVLPVGVDPALFELQRTDDGGPPVVLWNHRWEYDKDPDTFFSSLDELVAAGIEFRVAVAGKSFQTVPAVFEEARRRLHDRVVQFGEAPRGDYVDLLLRSDVVVSTARHEFFGLAVAEAIAAGALPVLPSRLSYPELVPDPVAREWLYDDGATPTETLARALRDEEGRRAGAMAARANMAHFSWPSVIGRYDELLETLVGQPRLHDSA